MLPKVENCNSTADSKQPTSNQWRSQDLLSSGAQNGRACASAKILKPRPFPVKICVFRVFTRALHDQSRCRSAKDQYASEEAHAITTTRLPVVIVYVRQSIIYGRALGGSLYSSPRS